MPKTRKGHVYDQDSRAPLENWGIPRGEEIFWHVYEIDSGRTIGWIVRVRQAPYEIIHWKAYGLELNPNGMGRKEAVRLGQHNRCSEAQRAIEDWNDGRDA